MWKQWLVGVVTAILVFTTGLYINDQFVDNEVAAQQGGITDSERMDAMWGEVLKLRGELDVAQGRIWWQCQEINSLYRTVQRAPTKTLMNCDDVYAAPNAVQNSETAP